MSGSRPCERMLCRHEFIAIWLAAGACFQTQRVCGAAKKYAAFLASETVIKQIPRLLGPGLNKAGKFPTLITHSDDLQSKVWSPDCPAFLVSFASMFLAGYSTPLTFLHGNFRVLCFYHSRWPLLPFT